MLNIRDQNRQALACLFIILLGGQEALAARENFRLANTLRTAMNPHSTGGRYESAAGGSFEKDALGRLEELYDKVNFEVREWSKSRPENEEPSETSLAEMRAHLDRTVISTSQFKGAFEASALSELQAVLEKAKAKVENMNLFLCKRSVINGYTDEGMIFQDRKLENGYFQVKCSMRQNMLNRGKVGESVTGKTKKDIENGIDTLKEFTKMGPGKEDTAFPIKLKMCTRKGGCSRSSNDTSLANTEDDIFGQGGLTDRIPIPAHLKDYLPRVSHKASHLYAVCFDDQDECDGMMWVPRNLHTCSGWFEADDTRVTLGQLRDAVMSGWFSRLWTPSGKDRLVQSIGHNQDLLQDDDVLSEDISVDQSHAGSSCVVEDVQKTEEAASKDDIQEVRTELSKVVTKKNEVEMELRSKHQAAEIRLNQLKSQIRQLEDRKSAAVRHEDYDTAKSLKDQIDSLTSQANSAQGMKVDTNDETYQQLQRDRAEFQKQATAICKDAEEAGEGVNCDVDDTQCRNLAQECQSCCGLTLKQQCKTQAQMEVELKQPQSDINTEEARTPAVSYGYSRRRRRSHIAPLFPSYYYYHQPYCYSWYGGYGYHPYAYPIVPMYGYGPGYGMWMYPGVFTPSMHLDFMIADGLVRMAYYAGAGLVHVGQSIGSSVGSVAGGNMNCDGEGCAIAVVAALLLIVLIIVIWAVHSHCTSNEENCHSWWYRGGRMRTKAKKWGQLWTGIEENVYDEMESYLLFDATLDMPNKDSCVKQMQWGRRWVGKDGKWNVKPSREEFLNGHVESDRI